ncbi:YSIRK-type signal peptide-containing protein [Streptococcus uberis]|uniref:Signal peptide protein n=1 Tax=Streptococcus uberis TaxID=1349 RepID=A0A6L6G913_STRUB|nr:YSIRK-type signal peptide-containing protein [Streptococcus uberis]MTB34845.1 signal peptide protein [Streptococcus uberis]MTB36731.1 signal peptide protein [Streptococcus uberis]MTB54501.1 signal peptide protein [Streptococcus uberis]MTB61245.1 signal peptide protein [Streptococcus uberis]MTB77678.1 signal peptide protein [Streptococcus uberis]
METKEIYSFRKFKTGTHSALIGKFGIALTTSIAIMTAGGVVHANTITTSTTSQVTPTTSVASAEIPTSVPAETSQSTAEKTINSAQDTLRTNVSNAAKAGVDVTTGTTTDIILNNSNVVDKTNEVLTDLSHQDKAVADAKAKQEVNQKAYTDAKTTRDTAVSKGQSDLSHAEQGVDDQITIAKKDSISVTTDSKDLTPKYIDTKGLTGSALTTAMEKNIALYNQAVNDGVGIMDASSVQMKKQIADYLTALTNYQKGVSSNTGLQWQNSVVLEAGSGASRQTGTENVVDFSDGTIKAAGMYATQGQNLDQNTDANFDNIFKIEGTGIIWVKNTTNGDVKLTFSEINSPYNTGTYVAIWGDDKGGIAWSVFALYYGGASGGAGETGSNTGSGISGRILNYVNSYKATVETTRGVSVVTFNDIDNKQTVKMSGLDNAKVTTGENINQTGNDFVAGSGDVSQSSAGVLGTNGVKWTFTSADRRLFSFTHSTAGTKNTSIVGGIFGSASNVPQKPVIPKLTAHKAIVTGPKGPSIPVNQKVTVHYYKVSVTPTPENPVTPQKNITYKPITTTPQTPVSQANVGLPTTGDKADGSIVQMVIGALMVSFVGFSALKDRKKEK